MNTSDFSVVTKDISTSLHAAKGGTRTSGKKSTPGEVEDASEKGGQPGKFPKLKLVKGKANDAATEQTEATVTAASAQPVVFDSLLAQIERKILEDTEAEAAQAGENSGARGDSRQMIGNLQAEAPQQSEKPVQAGGATLFSLPLGRTRPDTAAPQNGAEIHSLPRTANYAASSATAGSNRGPNADLLTGAPGIGKMYAALNDYMNAIQDKAAEPQATPTAAVHARQPQPDGQSAPDQGPSDHHHGSGEKQGPAAQAAAANWSAAPGVLHALAEQPGLANTNATPIAQQITAALKAEIAAMGGPSAAEQGPRVITVHLSPEGLGQLSIRLEKVDGALKVSLSAEHEATTAHLKSDAASLVTALEGLAPGFSASDLSFSNMNQRDGENRQNANQNGTNAGIAGHEQQPHNQSQEQASSKARPFDGSFQSPGLTGEAPARETGGTGRSSGAIYL